MPDSQVNLQKKTGIKVLMVCLGNICRSPTAEAVFRYQVEQLNLEEKIEIDSAGTGSWHIGHTPDKRASQAAANRNYDLSLIRARQVNNTDFEEFDYILAMDKENLRNLIALSPAEHHSKISLFLNAGDSTFDEVPDPYYSGDEGFELVLDLVEQASKNLLAKISQENNF